MTVKMSYTLALSKSIPFSLSSEESRPEWRALFFANQPPIMVKTHIMNVEPIQDFKSEMKSVHSRDVAARFVLDVETYVGQGTDRKKRLSFLSRKTDIHSKTFTRILSGKNQPSLSTIMRVYRFILNVESDAQVLKKLPGPIAKFLHAQFPDTSSQTHQKVEGAQYLFRENPVALEIFLLAAAGTLDRVLILKRFGMYGEEVIQQLIQECFISEAAPNQFAVGSRSVDFTPEVIIKAGQICTQRFAKPQSGYELGRHYAGFYLESLSPEGFQKWMEIEKESMQKKIKLAQDSFFKGDIPVFTFNIVETMSSEDT